jgi:phosphatidylglycerophosphate synthase
MQAVIVLPSFITQVDKQNATKRLMRQVAGVPLLKRVILTASRAGATEILLICPVALDQALLENFLDELSSYGSRIRVFQVDGFTPRDSSSWVNLEADLNDDFLWIPWNWVTSKQFLKDLPPTAMPAVDWSNPAHVDLHEVVRDQSKADLAFAHPEGVAITSPESISKAERFLVAHSGKVLDGIHTSFNRRLCRPFVRLLSHTSITPNAVTFIGVLVSVLSAIAFARGSYLYSVLGALLFYIAGLFDEMDGMLARIKFAESPWGTWFEGFADGLSYLLLFGGIAIGLSHRYGRLATLMGVLLLIGTIFALITTSLQRRRATAADRPNEYLGRMYQLLDKDSGNWISRFVRQLQAFVRRGILVHYIVIFTIIGALPLVFFLATIGAHLTWILTLYFNRRFFAQSLYMGTTPTIETIKETL